MDDLALLEHLPLIRGIVERYVAADVQLRQSINSIDGKLGQARWGEANQAPLISLPAHLTAAQISDSLLALALRGHVDGFPALSEFASSVEDPVLYLKHLVLHEVAHIVNGWPQVRETECDLWALTGLHRLGASQ